MGRRKGDGGGEREMEEGRDGERSGGGERKGYVSDRWREGEKAIDGEREGWESDRWRVKERERDRWRERDGERGEQEVFSLQLLF